MKFCKVCESLLNKTIGIDGSILFSCPRCPHTEKGGNEDTLMFEEYFRADESVSKYADMISNAPFDLAGHIVAKPCLNCSRDYMTLVRIGRNESTIYACSCGAKYSHVDYEQMIAKKTKSVRELRA